MRQIKYKQKAEDGAYGKSKNKNLEYEERKSKWIVPRMPRFCAWPEEAVSYSHNSINGHMQVLGDVSDTPQSVANQPGELSAWNFDGNWNQETLNLGLKSHFMGQPLNMPFVVLGPEDTPTISLNGTGCTMDATVYNRPDFEHQMMMNLPYLKQYHTVAASAGVLGAETYHTVEGDAGSHYAEQGVSPWNTFPNNKLLHMSGMPEGVGDIGSMHLPYYQKMWCSSIKFKLSYTVTMRGAAMFGQPASFTNAAAMEGRAQLPESNVLKIGFTPYKAMSKFRDVSDAQWKIDAMNYSKGVYVSDSGQAFKIDTNYDMNETEQGDSSWNERASPFPATYQEFMGNKLSDPRDTTAQEINQRGGPMYSKTYLIKGNTTFTDSITGTIVPHKFLGLEPMDSTELRYKDLAFNTSSDLTMVPQKAISTSNKKTELGSYIVNPALTALSFTFNDVGTLIDSRDSAFRREVKEKMNHVIGSVVQCATKYKLPAAMKINIDTTLELERTNHYFHDGQQPTYYQPAAHAGAVSYNMQDWVVGVGDRESNTIPPPAVRPLWPNDQETFNQ